MPRSYCTVSTSIWRENAEFAELTGAAQRVYILLITQPDISAVGILPLTIRRWAGYAADTTEESVTAALRALEERRFVVIDWDREELLVRSFLRWDNGFTNSKRLRSIHDAAAAIGSKRLAWAIRVEFERLGLATHGLSHSPSDGASDGLSRVSSHGGQLPEVADLVPDAPSEGRPVDEPVDEDIDTGDSGRKPPSSQVDAPSDARWVVVRGSSSATPTRNPVNPEAPSHEPPSSLTLAGDEPADGPEASPSPKPRKPRAPDVVWDALIQACALDPAELTPTARGACNRAVKDLKTVGATPEQIAERAATFVRTWPKVSLTPTALARHWATLANQRSAPTTTTAAFDAEEYSRGF